MNIFSPGETIVLFSEIYDKNIVENSGRFCFQLKKKHIHTKQAKLNIYIFFIF